MGRMPPGTRVELCLAFASFSSCGPATEASSPRFEFVDRAAAAGVDVVNISGDPRRWYILESNGCGAAFLDHDADGDMDLFVANGAELIYHDDGKRLEVVHSASSRLYRNDGDWRLCDVTDALGARTSAWTNAVATGDVENDGDCDLFLANFGADQLLVNSAGSFADRTGEAGLGSELWGAGAAFGDADCDGDLDLYVANYCLFDPEHPPLEGRRNVIDGVEVGWGPEEENKQGANAGAPDVYYENDGTGRFAERTDETGLSLVKPLCSYACVWSDVDDDGWQDLLVANDLQASNLFHNLGRARFREEGIPRGFAFDANGRATGAMGLAVEDVDQDGDQDVFKTNFDFEANSLYVNDGRGGFRDLAHLHGLAAASVDKLGWGAAFFDAELDGDLDLLVANGHVYPRGAEIGMGPWLQPTQLFEATRREGRTTWRDATVAAGSGLAEPRSARGIALGDVDDDGDLDACVVDMDGPPRLLENRSPHRGRWISVRTIGVVSNRDGLGAKVEVEAGGRRFVREMRTSQGLYGSHDPRLHFGLGEVERVERVIVRWPSERVSVLEDVPLDAPLVVTEPTEELSR